MPRCRIILMTVVLWLVGCSLYAYYWVTSNLAQPDTYGYERWVMFPLMGFLFYRFPFLLIGLLLLIFIEFILTETLRSKFP